MQAKPFLIQVLDAIKSSLVEDVELNEKSFLPAHAYMKGVLGNLPNNPGIPIAAPFPVVLYSVEGPSRVVDEAYRTPGEEFEDELGDTYIRTGFVESQIEKRIRLLVIAKDPTDGGASGYDQLSGAATAEALCDKILAYAPRGVTAPGEYWIPITVDSQDSAEPNILTSGFAHRTLTLTAKYPLRYTETVDLKIATFSLDEP